MASVWLSSALTAYADIFPPDAPKPTHASLCESLRGGRSLVAVADEDIVGLVQADDGWLSHLYVDPTHWGKGAGSALHDAALELLRADDAKQASLWVLEKNASARAMYERRGWALTDETRPVYEPAAIVDVRYSLTL